MRLMIPMRTGTATAAAAASVMNMSRFALGISEMSGFRVSSPMVGFSTGTPLYRCVPPSFNPSAPAHTLSVCAELGDVWLCLSLTQIEFSLLQTLLENRGRTVSARELSERVWDDAVYISRSDALAVHVRHLREKLHDTAKPFAYIQTSWGKGYRVE